jgi:hypothetical protein
VKQTEFSLHIVVCLLCCISIPTVIMVMPDLAATKSSALSAAMARGLPVLRDYLDEIGFVRIYKFIVTAGVYQTNPNVVSWWNLERMADLESYVTGDRDALGLAACLMLKVAVPCSALSALEQRVAEPLIEAGLVVQADGNLQMGGYQLISAQDMPLLIDSRINYPGVVSPEVYFGRDSLHLMFYVDTSGIAPADPVLDLGTGSGVMGLSLARYSDRVTMTDVSPRALELAHMNRLLNRMAARVAIREAPCEDTLRERERYRVVTFNPPFMPVPDGLDAPAFARGLGRDGLGYCRMLLEHVGQILRPDGAGYLVANLLGSADGPFFAEELRAYADRHDLRIDVFIESSTQLTAGAPIFEALGGFLHEQNPAIPRQACPHKMEELQLRTLGATHAYLSVLVIRGSLDTRPSVRVFHWKDPR